MQRKMCKSKIYGLKVTHKSIKSQGSIELPADVLEAADILPGEFVLVINENNAERFETYVIKGKPGVCGLLGGAARLGEVGDGLLVLSYGFMDTAKAEAHSMRLVEVGENNKLKTKK